MKFYIFFAILICLNTAQAQISGKVTDEKGEPLAFVNVYIENSYSGTTTNDDGFYKLEHNKTGEHVVVFQYLGYQTQKKNVQNLQHKTTLNATLEPESYSLDEVVVSATENPANRIIRNAIEKRKENNEKIKEFTADFYSRGMWKVKDVPEKIFGQEVGDLDGALDSTRTGIVYLSETVSKIAYRKPDDFKEHITASKVSGDDNGFSFNSAQEANFIFYENTIDINVPLVSPIAVNAFGYYSYKLEGVFYESGQLINKISVTPKRENDRVFEGVIYIVEDSWQIYGIELTTTGKAIQIPFVTQLNFKQSFSYDKQEQMWIKRSQTIDFGFAIFGMKGDGRFTAVYSNYNLNPDFEKKSFTNEVLSFEENANQKDSLFWRTLRPVPLTTEESDDYIRRDSIQTVRKSKSYLDSIDRKNNKFKILSPILGYSYSNTYAHKRFTYDGLLGNIFFNTIQGWNASTGFSYRNWYDEDYSKYLLARVNVNYGFSDERVRWSGSVSKRFNRFDRKTVSISGGNKVQQFNRSEPISPLINSSSSLYFERNYLKAYDLTYGSIGYSQEVTNGIQLTAVVGYEKRQPLFNTTDQYFIDNKNVSYTSNNPLAPSDFSNAAIDEHELFRFRLRGRFVIGQKYMSYPDAKFNIGDSKFPVIQLGYEKGFAASNSDYNFDHFKLGLTQNLRMGSLGTLTYNLKGGMFSNADNISFADFRHFNGNQTRVGTSSSYTNVFNLLPYYALSTNKSYVEAHAEHDFKGYILGKIPLLNKLNYNLVIGGHYLSTEDNKPYREFSAGFDNVGFGKFRFLRIDYVHSFFENGDEGAFIFGLKFLDMF